MSVSTLSTGAITPIIPGSYTPISDTCARCGGKLKVIASIEEPQVIARILAHLEKTAPDSQQAELPLRERAPPTQARLI